MNTSPKQNIALAAQHAVDFPSVNRKFGRQYLLINIARILFTYVLLFQFVATPTASSDLPSIDDPDDVCLPEQFPRSSQEPSVPIGVRAINMGNLPSLCNSSDCPKDSFCFGIPNPVELRIVTDDGIRIKHFSPSEVSFVLDWDGIVYSPDDYYEQICDPGDPSRCDLTDELKPGAVPRYSTSLTYEMHITVRTKRTWYPEAPCYGEYVFSFPQFTRGTAKPGGPEDALAIPSIPVLNTDFRSDPRESIDFATGAFDHEDVDWHLPGRGFDFIWARTKEQNPDGYSFSLSGFILSYDIVLDKIGSFSVYPGQGFSYPRLKHRDNDHPSSHYFDITEDILRLRNGRGRTDYFRRTIDTEDKWYCKRSNTYIEKTASSYILRFPDGGTWTFPAVGGKLQIIRDRYDNTMAFTYDTFSQLTGITDTVGRQFEIVRDGGTITKIWEPATGRSVQYSYDLVGEAPNQVYVLTGVIKPDGTERHYTYDVFDKYPDDTTKGIISHLRTIKDKEARLIVQNSYLDMPYDLPSGDSYKRGWLESCAVGGTAMTLEYLKLPSSGNAPCLRTTLTDRNGHPTTYEFDWWNREVKRVTGGAITSRSYNDFHLLTEITYPNNRRDVMEYEFDRDRYGPLKILKNLRSMKTTAGVGGGPALERSFVHHPNFGSIHGGFEFLTGMVDERGQTTSFAVNATNGNRVSMTQPDDGLHEYGYDDHGRVTSHTYPPNGLGGTRRTDSFVYAGNGAYVTTENLGGNATTYVYIDDLLRTITDPEQNVTSLTYDGPFQKLKTITKGGITYTIGWDNLNNENLVSVKSSSLEILYPTYDVLGFLKQEKRTVLGGVGIALSSVDTFFDYDFERNLKSVVQGPESVLYDYNNRNLPIRKTVNGAYISEFEYDLAGNLTKQTDGVGQAPRVTRYGYDGHNRMVSSTDPAGVLSQVAYDPGSNVLSWKRGSGASAVKFDFEYDPVSRMKKSTALNTAGSPAVTQYTYSPASVITAITDPRGKTTGAIYDEANRLSAVDAPGGVSTDLTYDGNSNVETVTESDVVSGASRTTTLLNDAFSRVESVSEPGAGTTQFGYDAQHQVTSITDPRGTNAQIGNNALSLPETNSITGNGIAANLGAEWNAGGRLKKLKDGQNNGTVYRRDLMGRIDLVTYPDTTQLSIVYDAHGNVTKTIDPNGTVIDTTYDALNRPLRRTIQPGSNVSTEVTFEEYTWDENSRLLTAKNDISEVEFTYDSLGRVLKEKRPRENNNTTEYTYDPNGNMLTCKYPGGFNISSTYDDLNRRQTVKLGDESSPDPVIARYTYDQSRVKTKTFPVPQIIGTFGYDAGERMNSITYTRPDPNPALPPVNLDVRSLTWDVNGNVEAASSSRAYGEFDKTLTPYDGLNRLRVSTEGTDVITYDIDNSQNWVTVTGGPSAGSYVAAAGSYKYTLTPKDERGYDSNGNMTSLRRSGPPLQYRTYKYNHRNQLVQFKLGTTTVNYQYDALGRQISRTALSGNNETSKLTYYYDGFRIIQERNAGDTVVANYIYGNAIDELLCIKRYDGCWADYYCLTDHLYSVTAMTDAQANVVEYYEYSDYGQPTIYDQDGEVLGGSFNTTLFTGRRYDFLTGLYDYRTRHMDPYVGRFISPDSIGNWGDAGNLGNTYAYVGNNPWSKLDAFGLSANYEWHHLFPQEFVDNNKYANLGISPGDVHAKELGWLMPADDHRFIHNKEKWNKLWEAWLMDPQRRKIRITRRMVLDRIDEMKGMKAFRDIFMAKTTFPAPLGYKQWRETPGQIKSAAIKSSLKLRKEMLKSGTKGTPIIKYIKNGGKVYVGLSIIASGTDAVASMSAGNYTEAAWMVTPYAELGRDLGRELGDCVWEEVLESDTAGQIRNRKSGDEKYEEFLNTSLGRIN